MDDLSDPGAAPAAAAEGSLPPRKRLLLKSGSGNPPSSEGTPNLPSATTHKMDSAEVLAPPAADAAITSGDSCSRCGSKDNSIWRRVKKAGVYQRLCNTCTMLYSMNMYCPYCLVVYQDAQLGDPQLWLNCAHCKRSVHVACEAKHSGAAADPAAYSCPECRKPATGKPEENSAAAAAAATSPNSKKPRLMKPGNPEVEPGNTDGETEVKPGNTGGVPPTPKSGAAAAAHEALQAAKMAAQQASKAAAQAKATALAKAQAAAKAAMAAKAALDVAAQAARDEIDARAELRRNGVRLEPRGYAALAAAAKLESPENNPASKGKEEGAPAPGDEELARQLHRAMNSSPRNPKTGARGSPGASPSEAKQENNQAKDGMAVDTQGFPSTYLADGGNSFPFDILAGFPSHEIQAGVIPGVTGVISGGAGGGGGVGAMEVDAKPGDGEKKNGVPEGDKGDNDVSFFGAPDPKFEIPGKWNEDVKGGDEEKQQQGQIAVDDYTVVDAAENPLPLPVSEGMKGSVEPGGNEGGEGLQGTQTAIATEAPDAEMKVNAVAEKDLTV